MIYRKRFTKLLTAGCSLLVVGGLPSVHGIEKLERNSRLAVIGDSITAQNMYSANLEVYIRACAGRTDVQVMKIAQGGEHAPHFLGRQTHDLQDYKPTAVTMFYGMNDGQYKPLNEKRRLAYRNAMDSIIKNFKNMGVKTMVIGSPGAVDTTTFNRKQYFPGSESAADSYNDTLKQLGYEAKSVSKANQVDFVDVHSALLETMKKAKKANGKDYILCGSDGIHPSENGHLVLSYAFLKGLGFDGTIGKISIDMKGTAKSSDGHTILSVEAGVVKIKSRRYPFCLGAAPKNKINSSAAGVLPFVPFQQELNRFILEVPNLATDNAKVVWGDKSKVFTRAELESGINLVEEFPLTPFDKSFESVVRQVKYKQRMEHYIVREIITHFRAIDRVIKGDDDVDQAVLTIRKKLMKRWSELDQKVIETIKPVNHTIKIEPLS